ncbi:MAG: Fic family protein [Tannerellaceae bacterium]|jgi:fido (protein-threonine AMPylation protein)/biotin operon repressor|nr:Fic family protein [Tannerellaceae bacterium]
MKEFEEYIKQGEPGRKEKGVIWQTSIGLQQVDDLIPSPYLIETAREHIEGGITIEEVKKRLEIYYKTQSSRQDVSEKDRTEEADKVSARIVEILSEATFSFSPSEYIGIHRRLFKGIYKFAGKIRDYNITKSEWVLEGKTVFYGSAAVIEETLAYDFREEKRFRYAGLSKEEQIAHIARFISGLWQIHAFGEGNTRTTAVFSIRYLRTFGFQVENEAFANHSRYFRNALVRANYNDYTKNIYASMEYLNRFFENLLLGRPHILRNRELHIRFMAAIKDTNKLGVSKDAANGLSVNDVKRLGINLNKNQEKILELIVSNPKVTIVEMSKQLSVSETAIENNIKKLKEKCLLTRVGSDKTGHWILL